MKIWYGFRSSWCFDRRERRNQDSMTFITVNRERGTGKRFLFVCILKFIVSAVAMWRLSSYLQSTWKLPFVVFEINVLNWLKR